MFATSLQDTGASHAINQVMLTLHRDGRELQLHSFQRWALEQVRHLIHFDSAWWCNGASAQGETVGPHLFNCDASLAQAYPAFSGHDFFRLALNARPGVCINLSDLVTREQLVRTEFYRNVGKHYRIEWSLGTLLHDSNATPSEFLTLWRHDPNKPFSEEERQAKELLMPHLMEAYRAARLRHFLRDRSTSVRAWALADNHGYIREMSPAFAADLKENWPQWQGDTLPSPLATYVLEACPYVSKTLSIDIRASSNLRFLEVRPKNLLRQLTPRECEIINRYANGETYSGIANALALSPATVRNHIANCFRKLSVKNKAELVRRLNPPVRASRH